MKTNTTVTLILAALVMSLTGCSPSAPSAQTDPLDIGAILDDTTPFQRDILDDGVVTAAEFERALLARRECVSEAGATPGEIYEGRNGELTFDYDITADNDEELQSIQSQADACLADYFSDVGSVWAYQRLLSPEEREAMRPRALACLDEAGLTGLAEDATASDMAVAVQDDGEISAAERDCLVEYGSLFATHVDDTHDHTE